MPSAVAIIAVLGLGWSISAVILRSGDLPGVTGARLCASPAIGYGIVSLTLFAVRHFQGGNWIVWGVVLVGVCVSLALCMRQRGLREDAERDPWTEKRVRRARVVEGPLLLVFLFVCGLVALRGLEVSKSNPYGSWDAIAMWNLHARILNRAPENSAAVFGRLEAGHPEYPLLLPGAIAGQFALVGHESLVVPTVTGIVVFAAAVGTVIWLVWATAGMMYGLAAGITLLVTPAIGHFGFDQCADVPVSYTLVLAVGLVSLGLRSGSHKVPWRPFLVAGFVLGCLIWLKNEGMVHAMIVMGVTLVVAVGRRMLGSDGHGLTRALISLVAGAVPGLAALVVFRLTWVGSREAQAFLRGTDEKLLSWDRWSTVLHGMVSAMLPPSGLERWGLWWVVFPLLVVLYAFRGRLRGNRVIPLLTSGFAILAYVGFYVLSPYDLAWHIPRSIDRLLVQLLPLTVFGLFGILVAGDRRGAGSGV